MSMDRDELAREVRYRVREAMAASGRAWQALDADPRLDAGPRLLDCAAALQTTIRDARVALSALEALGVCVPPEPRDPPKPPEYVVPLGYVE